MAIGTFESFTRGFLIDLCKEYQEKQEALQAQDLASRRKNGELLEVLRDCLSLMEQSHGHTWSEHESMCGVGDEKQGWEPCKWKDLLARIRVTLSKEQGGPKDLSEAVERARNPDPVESIQALNRVTKIIPTRKRGSNG